MPRTWPRNVYYCYYCSLAKPPTCASSWMRISLQSWRRRSNARPPLSRPCAHGQRGVGRGLRRETPAVARSGYESRIGAAERPGMEAESPLGDNFRQMSGTAPAQVALGGQHAVARFVGRKQVDDRGSVFQHPTPGARQLTCIGSRAPEVELCEFESRVAGGAARVGEQRSGTESGVLAAGRPQQVAERLQSAVGVDQDPPAPGPCWWPGRRGAASVPVAHVPGAERNGTRCPEPTPCVRCQ